MKKYYFMAAAAIAALSSCSNDENILEPEVPAANVSYPTFTATIEGVGTRTELAGNKVEWVDGDDVLLIFGTGPSDETLLKYKATPNTDATTATLTPPESANSEVGPLVAAFYPASLVTDSQDDDIPYQMTYPATQQYAGEGKIPFAPMIYANTDYETSPLPSTLAFKNVASLLKITVPSTQMTSVKSITVSSDAKMHGFVQPFGDNSYIYVYNDEDFSPENCQLTLDCGEGVAIPDGESKTFYISILPLFAGIDEDACGESYGYLQIDVTDGTTTKSMRTTKADGIQIERNKIYPITFKEDTKGTAKATIGGSEVDVKWVQLWAGGPKFAEKNVGANSATEQGTTMTFTEAIAEGAGYVWGANWRTPSKDDMDELLMAATIAGSEKVTCTYTVEGGVYGFKFIGKEAGYTENSVFFPAQDGAGDYGDAHYWSGTAASVGANNMWLIYSNDWFSYWDIGGVNLERLVRPVLKN